MYEASKRALACRIGRRVLASVEHARAPVIVDVNVFQHLVAPVGLAMLFSASISLAYLLFHKDDRNVQRDSLILFGVLFVFTGVRLLLPHDY
jgi:hypothetical protein